jgi:hypothetical protein
MTRTGTASAAREQPPNEVRPPTTRVHKYAAAALVILFLASVARFYHRDTGFTALIGFPEGDHFESPALHAMPHYEYPIWASYDGQFYAQRAFDPFLRDPDIDHAMDSAPFRARRILFSWTAYVLGLGRPAWILQAYALQNVACWLVLAFVLTRWIPLTSARNLALWTACLFSHGFLWSVRFALLDGPSLALITWAVAAVERGRLLLSAAIAGVAALGRETNVLALFAQPPPRDRRSAIRIVVSVALAALPSLVWYDYLRSIYRSTLLTGADSFMMPGAGLFETWRKVLSGVAQSGLFTGSGLSLCLLISLALQAVYLCVRRDVAAPWWRIAAAYGVLMLFLHSSLVDPNTGAITRVLLPMTVGFNVLLATEERAIRFWPWFVAGNAHLLPALWVMPLVSW